MKRAILFVAVLFCLLRPTPALYAQVGTEGVILGVVTDQSGAVVPEAEVTVQNLDTGLTKTVKTNGAGIFEIFALPVGFYSVSVSMQGFKSWKLDRVELTVGERKRLAPVLELGKVTEQVSVQSTAPLMQTDTAQTGGIVEQKQILDLPLNGRNPMQLVTLVPGVRFLGTYGPERGSYIQGLGSREDSTEFQLDGLNINAGMDEGAVGVPNLDTIAEFNVETANFSAEHGRNPMQVLMVTKGGTNAFHGTLWEFHRNDKLDARNTFAASTPKLIRNQFGGEAGGPIIRNKTFFFGSFEGITIRQEQIFNSPVVQPAWLQGDFSSFPSPITDPQTGKPFPGNSIPADRIADSAKFFFPYLLLPNSPDGNFHAVAPVKNDTRNIVGRIDHQISDKQRIYGRYIFRDNPTVSPDYRPQTIDNDGTKHHSIGLTYNYTITPTTLLTVDAGYVYSNNVFSSPGVGKENLTEEAGIQGFPSAGRGQWLGLPSTNFSGYTGFEEPWGVPGRLWMEAKDAKAALNLIRGKHTFNLGYEYNNRTTFGKHGSFASRGYFSFDGQYTGNSFADYLLGLVQSSGRNYPLQTFGMKQAPYDAIYAQDFINVTPKFSLNLGVRFDWWQGREAVCGVVSGFDPKSGKAVAGMDNSGNVNLACQPVSPFLAKATEGLWVAANQVGYPKGLYNANGYVSPRLGAALRVRNDLVVRGAYGIFAAQGITGNNTASAVIGPPYWNYEFDSFSAQSLQRWETAFPADPTAFVAPSVYAPAVGVGNQRTHEWNVSIQKMLPLQSALTLGYQGNHVFGAIAADPLNEVPPGNYPDLQAAKPYAKFGQVFLYEKLGPMWYNGLTAKWERRFTQGLGFTLSYAYGKHMIEKTGVSHWDAVQPFTPPGYLRGRAYFDRTHVLTVNTIYDLPFGRGRKYLTSVHPVVNGFIGGWELTGILSHTAGDPLTLDAPGATLGNGWDTRPNLIGNPHVANPSAALWFNPDAFAAPPPLTYGSSGIGILTGPGSTTLDTGLLKNFHFTESRYLQFRWEMFNSTNHVNLGDPVTTFGIPGVTGHIYSAGDARQMQFGLKLYF